MRRSVLLYLKVYMCRNSLLPLVQLHSEMHTFGAGVINTLSELVCMMVVGNQSSHTQRRSEKPAIIE